MKDKVKFNQVSLKSIVNLELLLTKQIKFKNEDFLSHILGKTFQTKLRQERDKKTYTCEHCHGKGYLISPQFEPAFMKMMSELANITAGEAVKSIVGEDTKYIRKDNKGYLSAATIVFNQEKFFKKTAKLKSEINRQAKEKEHKLFVEGLGIEDTKKLVRNNYDKIKKMLDSDIVGICPYCLGNGYYDIGHQDIEGKVYEVITWLFEDMVVSKRLTHIRVQEIWKHFRTLKIKPEWAGYPGTNAQGLTNWTDIKAFNRFQAYSNAVNTATNQLRKRIDDWYKNNGTKIKEESVLTYEALLRFFPSLIQKARQDTGTLKFYLAKARNKLKGAFHKYTTAETSVGKVINPKTKKIETRFRGDTYFLQGPTSLHRTRFGKKSPKSNKLFIYAGVYSDLSTGHKPWNEDDEKVSQIALKYFNPAQIKFIKFFEQGYHAN